MIRNTKSALSERREIDTRKSEHEVMKTDGKTEILHYSQHSACREDMQVALRSRKEKQNIGLKRAPTAELNERKRKSEGRRSKQGRRGDQRGR